MRTGRIGLSLLALLALLAGAVKGAVHLPSPDQKRRVTAVRTEQEINLDGKLEEAAWKLAQPTGDFIQKQPIMGAPATERTEVRLLYDDRNLYVGVYCFDSAGAEGVIINDITKDFYTLDSDGFQIVIDTYNDDRSSFLFGTNPGAGRFDMQIGSDGEAGNSNWDGVWYVRTQVNDQGWQAEIAIPFKTLRFRNLEEQVWGVNFERRVRRKFEDSYWSPIPPPYRLGRVSLAGDLDGLQALPQGRNLFVKPYVSAPLLRREGDDVDFMPDAGIDIKYGLTSQLTLDLTANTDFSQVEADEEQINLTRFSLFFPEKREFFLENAGIFQFARAPRRDPLTRAQRPDLIPFFSRRIGIEDNSLVPILGGARVSGRAGKYTMGLLTMQTDDFEETPSTNFTVARLRRDVLSHSDVGGLFVNKQDGEGHFNRTFGFDGNFNFYRFLDINSFVLKTETPGQGDDNQAGGLDVSWRDDFFDVRAGQLWIGEDFNPEVGFAPRRGMRKSSGGFALTPRPRERVRWIRELRPSTEIEYITGPNDTLETRRIENRFTLTASDSSVLSAAWESNFEHLDEPFQIRRNQFISPGDYRFDDYSIFYRSDRSRMLSVETRLATGTFWDGDRNSYHLGLAFQPNYHFQAQVFWTRNDIDLPGGDFETDLLTTRLNYSFATNLFLNALIQYNSAQREINSNIRFNFMHKPLSDFYLVYNERRSSTGEVIERALVAKLTHMFSF